MLPAVLFAAMAGYGLYAIGSEAVEHKAIVQAGLPRYSVTDADDRSGVAEDLIAYAAMIAVFSFVADGIPSMIEQARALAPR